MRMNPVFVGGEGEGGGKEEWSELPQLFSSEDYYQELLQSVRVFLEDVTGDVLTSFTG